MMWSFAGGDCGGACHTVLSMSVIEWLPLCRLHIASEDHHHALSKKKLSEAIDGDEKLLPIDALGVVMIQHGEEFGDDSAFGTC